MTPLVVLPVAHVLPRHCHLTIANDCELILYNSLSQVHMFNIKTNTLFFNYTAICLMEVIPLLSAFSALHYSVNHSPWSGLALLEISKLSAQPPTYLLFSLSRKMPTVLFRLPFTVRR